MFSSISDFLERFREEKESTQKIFSLLTDENLSREVCEGFRSIGRMAWHIVQTLPEMGEKVGLKINGPSETDPVPRAARDIREAYIRASDSLISEINRNWHDNDLNTSDDMYGQRWPRRKTLTVLLNHEIHHRAQMIVLFRQAGARVPGIYGPTREEWSKFNMPEPSV
jgi:uncharacterized damage-inducible protein DinB